MNGVVALVARFMGNLGRLAPTQGAAHCAFSAGRSADHPAISPRGERAWLGENVPLAGTPALRRAPSAGGAASGPVANRGILGATSCLTFPSQN